MPARATKPKRRKARFSPGLALAGLFSILVPSLAWAQVAIDSIARPDDACTLAAGEPGTVADVVDGDTLVLADGRIVRMVGIEAPKQYLARPGSDVSAIAEDARDALNRLAGGVSVALRLGEVRLDRHGRTLAQVYLSDGTWLQAAMVEAGFARVRPFAGDFSCLGGLVVLERKARDMGRGLWRSDEFSVISAHDPSLIDRKGLYVLVEGRVLSVGHGKRVDFLNFGRHWRSDFTVMVAAKIAERFSEIGLPIDALAERRVRIRGVIEERGGPAIRLNDPSEVEILDDD